MVRKAIMTHGAPTPETFGNVGDIRIDLDTNTAYRCSRVIVDGKKRGFITIYSNRRYNATHVWEPVSAGETETYILIDENGNEIPAVLVDSEVVFTAGPNDIREGVVAATADGVTVGTHDCD